MNQSSQAFLVVSLLVFCTLVHITNGKSLGLLFKSHNIKKRALYEETCPPPYVIEVTEQCNDSCLDDDYCVGNQMCCFDGCSYVCMDPVPSEPVIDWLDEDDFQEIRDPDVKIVHPVIVELGCKYNGMTLNDGETIALGCRRCSCFNANMMCDVSNCNKEYLSRLAVQTSGSASGGDDEDGTESDDAANEESGDKWFPINSLEVKKTFIPFKEDSGEQQHRNVQEFKDFDGEDENNSGDSIGRSPFTGEESGHESYPVHGLKLQTDFIPFTEGYGSGEFDSSGSATVENTKKDDFDVTNSGNTGKQKAPSLLHGDMSEDSGGENMEIFARRLR